ncbi:Aste57867_11151 [Aphanomyces stellatus]|uniref:Aste57867_11151 protein n=1 Tax=Aphanomyces stellatus TaxID=120398 RepID=A0A485KS74_9STRA|nr:hypothetical protein As57867_011109 [Aphanomyces stellatus]VFT88018.1 Aste57867_11151 [Aphanomyces stellatus]
MTSKDQPSVCVAEVRFQNQTKKVAIYEGMSTTECSLLMQAAFFAPSAPEWKRKVVGFVHLKTKTFLPLLLGTAFPQLFQPNHTYELILEKASAATPPSAPPATTTAPIPTPTPKPSAPPAYAVSGGGMSSRPHDNGAPVEPWNDKMYGLLVHWDSHNTPGLPLEKLEMLLSEQHPQLRSAYEAYEASHDLDHLIQQVRRILAVLMQQTKSSFTRVVNQLPLLKPHDIALIHELFTQGNELVLGAWEVYELEEDKDELADTLLRIVRFKRQQAAPSLESICREMVERNLLTWTQYQGLLQLWDAKNEAMVGAVEAFHVDKDMKELVDTLLLVVKHAGLATHLATSPSSSVIVPMSPAKFEAPTLEELHPLSPKGKTAPLSPKGKTVPLSPAARATYGTFNTLTSPMSSSAPSSSSSASSFLPRLLDTLRQQSMISHAQHQLLSHLAMQKDARLASVAAEYKSTRDAKAFVQHVVDLCDVLHWEKNHTTILHKWIIPLEKQGVGAGLRQLWTHDDARLMAAYLLFVHDHQEDDFIDTLKRLSAIVSNDVDDDALDREIASSLVALHSSGKLSQDLLELLDPTDPKVGAAFHVFETAHDMDDLLDTLQRIGALAKLAIDDEAMPPPTSPKPDAMEKQLLHFVYELQLPADELAALKQAIADNDVVVQAAMEVFQVEADEDDFKDTLRRVARYNAGASEAVDVAL